MPVRLATLLVGLVFEFGVSVQPQAIEGVTARLRSAEAKPFMPGVWIDWVDKAVQVDARVVLREGMLELIACTPQTKEHESILRVDAAAVHIYQALGLLGLEPGQPPHWDPQAHEGVAATGPRLSIQVRHQRGDRVRTEDIFDWMWNSTDGEPAVPGHWIFSGSLRDEKGRLAADFEGTVICVVDFGTALISLPRSYSADNADLWLSPNTARLPKLGTPCVLIIRPLPASLRVIRLGRYGRILYDGERKGLIELQKALRNELEQVPDLTVEVLADAKVLQADLDAVSRLAHRAGLARDRLRVTRDQEQPSVQLNVDDMIALLKREFDVSGGVFHNIVADVMAFANRVGEVPACVISELDSLAGMLRGGGEPSRPDDKEQKHE